MKERHSFINPFFSEKLRTKSAQLAKEMIEPEGKAAILHLWADEEDELHSISLDINECETELRSRLNRTPWKIKIKALLTISRNVMFSPPSLYVLKYLRESTLFLPIIMLNKYQSYSLTSIHELLPLILDIKCDLSNEPHQEVNGLLNKARDWLLMDPDLSSRSNVESLLANYDFQSLKKLFANIISFGTGGIRAKLGPGYTQMNKIVIHQIVQGVVQLIFQHFSKEDCSKRPIAIGYDGRKFSKTFAHLTAAVLRKSGLNIVLFTEVIITPIISFTILHMNCLAGVMITASHNPKDYNGFKLFWENGAQIVSPRDKQLTELIRSNKEVLDVGDIFNYERGELTNMDDMLHKNTENIIKAYIKKMRETLKTNTGIKEKPFKITYTALHGSSGEIAKRAFEAFGNPNIFYVESQQHPDPEFPTVKCPNPEEGLSVLGLAMAEAEKNGSQIIFANDGDGDRLGVAEKCSGGGWRIFTGDEIGICLCYEMIERAERVPGMKYAIVNTLVCSQTAQNLAKAYKIDHFSTNIGYKWVSKMIDELEKSEYSILCSYEEANGYLAGSDLVRDKDGVGAMVVFMELAVKCYERGLTIAGLLDRELSLIIGGRVFTNNFYVLYSDPKVMRLIFENLRKHKSYPGSLGKYKVIAVRDITVGYDSRDSEFKCLVPADPSTEMITFWFEKDSVLTLRASGTEPKIKYYIEKKCKNENDADELKTLEEMVLNEIFKIREHPELTWPRTILI